MAWCCVIGTYREQSQPDRDSPTCENKQAWFYTQVLISNFSGQQGKVCPARASLGVILAQCRKLPGFGDAWAKDMSGLPGTALGAR